MKKVKEYITNSEEETKEIAREIFLNEIQKTLEKEKNKKETEKEEKKNYVLNIILNGDLASGKTKFVEGILEYFKLENEISSPTFTIVNEYIKDEKFNFFGKDFLFTLNHFDVYRLSDSSEFYDSGLMEYIVEDETKGKIDKIKVNLIEWGLEIEDVFNKDFVLVDIKKLDLNKRKITVLERE